jgi:uncharacterized protein YigA (DUF484 family)
VFFKKKKKKKIGCLSIFSRNTHFWLFFCIGFNSLFLALLAQLVGDNNLLTAKLRELSGDLSHAASAHAARSAAHESARTEAEHAMAALAREIEVRGDAAERARRDAEVMREERDALRDKGTRRRC